MTHRRLFRLLLLLGLLIAFQAELSALDGPEIHRRMTERDMGQSMHAIMKMTLIDGDASEKERIIETWSMTYDRENDLSQSVMEFKSPSAVKGTRFLQVQQLGRNDDQWIYLPALGRVRRIAAGEGSASFMGSDFTYDDMQLQAGEEKAEHVLLGEESAAGYDCWVLESRSLDEDASYSRLVSWITKEHFLPVKVDFYDRKSGALLKQMTVEDEIVTVNGIPSITKTRMKSVADGHQTLLETLKGKNGLLYLEYNISMDPARFTQKFLQTGK